MTHTVILDEADRDRRLVNHLNEILRHCRIGRVRTKIMSGYGHLLVPQPIPKHWLPDMKPAPTPVFSGGYVHISRADAAPA